MTSKIRFDRSKIKYNVVTENQRAKENPVTKYLKGKKPQIHTCQVSEEWKKANSKPHQTISGNPKPHPKLKNLKLVPNKRK